MLKSSEAGFTLLEQLIALFVVSIVVLLGAAFFSFFMTQSSSFSQFQETQLFFNHLATEAKEADTLVWHEEELQLQFPDFTLSYRVQRETVLQRFRNGRGFVSMVEGVDDFHCKVEEVSAVCRVQLDNGSVFERRVWTMKGVIKNVVEK
ncbi:prepilin-type N-terminal cleavage/methylation domain-containing protein [Bacillus sp. FSL W7-1360]